MEPNKGKIVRFKELRNDLQMAFFASEDELNVRGFKYFATTDRHTAKWFIIVMPISAALCLMVGGILSGKISLSENIFWSAIIFLILTVAFYVSFREKLHTPRGAGLLLTENELLFFAAGERVYIFPYASLDISLDDVNEKVIFYSDAVKAELYQAEVAPNFFYALGQKAPAIAKKFVEKNEETSE